MLVYLQVNWKVLYSTSSRDHGTLGHLCSLLRRSPQANDPKKDFNACRDLLSTILKGHYISTACEVMGIEGPHGIPDSEMLIQLQHKPEAQQHQYIHSIAQAVVNKCTIIGASLLFESVDDSGDMVYNYA